MMDEDKLHNELNNRIRGVFDNYEDTTADEGWALLRQKFPEEKKDRGLDWLWYAAAAIVLLGIGLWFMEKPVENKNLVVKNPKTTVQPGNKTNKPAPVAPSANQAENKPNNTTTASAAFARFATGKKANQSINKKSGSKRIGNPSGKCAAFGCIYCKNRYRLHIE
jgi:cytoskeletal protein RodZ